MATTLNLRLGGSRMRSSFLRGLLRFTILVVDLVLLLLLVSYCSRYLDEVKRACNSLAVMLLPHFFGRVLLV